MALEEERKQKDDLSNLIKQMEMKLISGGNGMDGLNEAKQDQIRKERELQKRLKKQKKKE